MPTPTDVLNSLTEFNLNLTAYDAFINNAPGVLVSLPGGSTIKPLKQLASELDPTNTTVAGYVTAAATSATNAHTSEVNAAASATFAAAQSTAVVARTALSTNLLEFLGPFGAIFAYVDVTMNWNVVSITSKTGYGVGTKGRNLADNYDAQAIASFSDHAGNVYAEVRADSDGLKAHAFTGPYLNGAPTTTISQLLGSLPLILGTATRYLAPVYGQSLAYGTGATPDPFTNAGAIALTTDQPYGNLMFNGGIRAWDAGGGLASLVPHIEAASGGVTGQGETILGGFQAMLFQLLNAYGLLPIDVPFRTISFSPAVPSTTIAQLAMGQTPFTNFMAGVTAGQSLSGGQNVQMPGWFWMQGESGQKDDGYIALLDTIASNVDTQARAILSNQKDPITCFTYQLDRPQACHWYTEAQRLSSLVRIVGPMYPVQYAGQRGAQFDLVHRTAPGYRQYGAQCAIAWFCTFILKRPWRPLQLSYDARGQLRCHVSGSDLIIYYDVPHGGWLAFDNGNWGWNWSRMQRGFYLFNAGGVEKPLGGVKIEGRNGVRLIGANAVATDIVRIGYKDPTLDQAASVATSLRDCQGDVITLDDGLGIRIDNWAIGQEHALTAAELAR